MQNSALAGQTVTPLAGSGPISSSLQSGNPQQATSYAGANGTSPAAGGNAVMPYNANVPSANGTGDPYASFISALQQIQAANPISPIAQGMPAPHKSQAASQATMTESGVG